MAPGINRSKLKSERFANFQPSSRCSILGLGYMLYNNQSCESRQCKMSETMDIIRLAEEVNGQSSSFLKKGKIYD
jgi:hypothetical protein